MELSVGVSVGVAVTDREMDMLREGVRELVGVVLGETLGVAPKLRLADGVREPLLLLEGVMLEVGEGGAYDHCAT